MMVIERKLDSLQNNSKDIQVIYHTKVNLVGFISSAEDYSITSVGKKLLTRQTPEKMIKITKIGISLHNAIKHFSFFVYYNKCPKLHLIGKNNASSLALMSNISL